MTPPPVNACTLIEMQAVEFFLDLLDAEETAELKAHVKACPNCANAVRSIRADFEVLARWDDVQPSRKSVIALMRAYGGGGGDLTVVLPGEAEEEAIAADVIADVEAAVPAAPGLLLGPTIGAEERARILGEFGFDASGLRTSSRRRRAQKAAVDLTDLTAKAEEAAARVSGRLSRSAAEGEWSSLAGTTRIAGDTRGPDQALRPDLAAKASSAWEKIKARRKKGSDAEEHAEELKRKRDSAKWEAMAGTTMLSQPDGEDLREELLLDEDENAAEALMGTTILSAQTTQSALMPRYQSRVLQKIKSEGEGKRKLKRAAAVTATRTPAWLIAVGGHAAAILAAFLVVWTVNTVRFQPQFRMKDQPPPPEEVPPEVEEELQLELDETDPTDDPTEKSDELEQTMREVAQINVAGAIDPNKREVEQTQPFVEPREGRSGYGTRGAGPVKAVEQALDWLQAHQSENGAWEWKNYRAQCEKHGGPACGGDEITEKEHRNFTPGLTALSVLAFTASGYQHIPPRDEAKASYKRRHGRRMPAVKAAVEWLLKQQDPDGAIGRKFRGNDDPDFEAGGVRQDPEGYMYNHAIGTLALCDLYATSRDPALQQPAQRALDFLVKARDPKRGGWDYYPYGHLPTEAQRVQERDRFRADLSITGWAVMALKVAEMADLKVPAEVRTDALAFIRRLDGNAAANPEPRYAEGYWTGWNADDVATALQAVKDHKQRAVLNRVQRDLKAGKVPEGRRGVAMTAVSALAKLYLGVSMNDGAVRAQVGHLLKNVPSEYALTNQRPGYTNHDHSYYYWYYGTLVLWNVDDERWHQWWDRALSGAITSLQITEGPAAGSWPAKDPVWGAYAGRIYSTALCTLTLEVFYRYAPLSKKQRGGLLADAGFAELQREVQEGLAWLRNPTGPPRPDMDRRVVEACFRLVDLAVEKGGEPDARKKREAAALQLLEQVAMLQTPAPGDAPADVRAWREQAARTGLFLREVAIKRLGKIPTHASVELCRKLVRAFAKDEPQLAVAAVSTLAAKPLVWAVRDGDTGELLSLNESQVSADLRSAAGVAYQRIREAFQRRAELLKARRSEAAAEAAGDPDGGD